jgi:diguanylate cyclase (GGDEF)-like protein
MGGNGRAGPSAHIRAHLSAEEKAQSGLEDDQTTADSDQSSSDADQSAADEDQAASDSDQLQADVDQRASVRDQAAADRDQAATADPDGSVERAADESRQDREETTLSRDATTAARLEQTTRRREVAEHRDRTARLRDLTAEARDNAAAARDAAAADFEAAMNLPHDRPGEARRYAASVRAQAARDREQAARDREKAAADREQAAHDREAARLAVENAHLDDLTGAMLRGIGRAALRDQIARARRSGEGLVLAFVDVDGLKQTNDAEGHAAGDDVLRKVVAAIRSKMRSYEPIVRVGGDEFLCALHGVDIPAARSRFEEVREVLDAAESSPSISVGFAAIRDDETLDELTSRSDAALSEVKANRR